MQIDWVGRGRKLYLSKPTNFWWYSLDEIVFEGERSNVDASEDIYRSINQSINQLISHFVVIKVPYPFLKTFLASCGRKRPVTENLFKNLGHNFSICISIYKYWFRFCWRLIAWRKLGPRFKNIVCNMACNSYCHKEMLDYYTWLL